MQEGTYLLQSVSGGGFIALANGMPYLAYSNSPLTSDEINFWEFKKAGEHWSIGTTVGEHSFYLSGGYYPQTTTNFNNTADDKWVIEKVEDEKYRAIKNLAGGCYFDGRNPLMDELLLTDRDPYSDAYLQWIFVRVEKSGDKMEIVEGELIDRSVPPKENFPVDPGHYLVKSKSGGGFLCALTETAVNIYYTEDPLADKTLHWEILPGAENNYTLMSVYNNAYLTSREKWGYDPELSAEPGYFVIEKVSTENHCSVGMDNHYLDGRNPGMDELLLTARDPYHDGYLMWELVPVLSHVKSARH